MKKLTAILLSLMMLLTLAACTTESNTDKEDSSSTNAPTSEPAEIVETVIDEADPTDEANSSVSNPFVEYTTLAEAEEAAGFSLNAPDTIGTSDTLVYRFSEEDGLLEIIYYEEDTEIACIRKSVGTEDISDDSNEYAEVTTLELDTLSITCKGKDDLIVVALWTDDTYTYAIRMDEGITEDELTSLISNLMDIATTVGMANPFVEYTTAEEAAAALGYETALPDAIGTSDNVLYRVMDKVLLEVIYYEGETEIARIRKAEGTEDISGINTLFTSEEEQEVEGRQVTFKGDGEKIQLAIWVEGAYTYSVYAEKGLELDAFTTVIATIS